VARKIFEGLGPGSLIPQRGSLPLTDPRLGPEEGFVLSRVDGHTSLDEVVLLVPFEEQVTMVILRKLWEMGAIDVPGVARVVRSPSKPDLADAAKGAAETPKDAPPRPGGLSDEQRKRVDELFLALNHRNAFELLGVTREADPKEIKRAYFKLSKEFHPDRFFGVALGEQGRKLSAIFQAVKNAFELLSDENRRAAYIETLDE
jgi:DnaJ domain